MARLIKQSEGRKLGLPGRNSLEIVSGYNGAHSVTLRLVEIPAWSSTESPRAPHYHTGFEECIFVMAGEGRTETETGAFELQPGDTLLIPSGEKHVTRNTGRTKLVLLCFFPVADVASNTSEAGR